MFLPGQPFLQGNSGAFLHFLLPKAFSTDDQQNRYLYGSKVLSEVTCTIVKALLRKTNDPHDLVYTLIPFDFQEMAKKVFSVFQEVPDRLLCLQISKHQTRYILRIKVLRKVN